MCEIGRPSSSSTPFPATAKDRIRPSESSTPFSGREKLLDRPRPRLPFQGGKFDDPRRILFKLRPINLPQSAVTLARPPRSSLLRKQALARASSLRRAERRLSRSTFRSSRARVRRRFYADEYYGKSYVCEGTELVLPIPLLQLVEGINPLCHNLVAGFPTRSDICCPPVLPARCKTRSDICCPPVLPARCKTRSDIPFILPNSFL